MKNIALIGFMGSGKTTVGKFISNFLKMDFRDTDKIISEQENTSIKNIFDTRGEAYFRRRETEVLKKTCLENNIVISTGGGIITVAENIDILRSGSIVFFLNVPLDTIKSRLANDTARPLWNSASEILYEKRLPIYKNACHYCISSKNSNESAIEILTIYSRVSREMR